MEKRRRGVSSVVERLVVLAMLTAVSVVLVALLHFPIIPAAPFLEYDPADIPIFIATLMYGPWWGLGMTVVVSLIQGLTVSVQSGWIGILMHICATGSFAVAAGLIFRRKKTIPRAAVSLGVGVVVMTVVMAGWNYLLTPIFMNTKREIVAGMMLTVFVPFNLIKAGVNAAMTMLLYGVLRRVIRRPELLDPASESASASS